MKANKQTSPWRWIPTLYIAEGLPYFAVNTLTVLMYVRLGIGLKEMAFYTGWLYLPWVIKPFWSPFVDLIKTKRWWHRHDAMAHRDMHGVGGFPSSDEPLLRRDACGIRLMAFFSATHDIAADGYYMIELDSHEQAAYVGLRSTFYRIASVMGQGGPVMLAGYLEEKTGDISTACTATFAILSAFFLAVAFYHSFFLPRPEGDKPKAGVTAHTILRDFGTTFVTFFQKRYIRSALAFMLLYRLPEALCLKLVQPFMVTPRAGGLALTTAEVGFVNGTIGVVALLAGGIVGGLAISRGGLKRWLGRWH